MKDNINNNNNDVVSMNNVLVNVTGTGSHFSPLLELQAYASVILTAVTLKSTVFNTFSFISSAAVHCWLYFYILIIWGLILKTILLLFAKFGDNNGYSLWFHRW